MESTYGGILLFMKKLMAVICCLQLHGMAIKAGLLGQLFLQQGSSHGILPHVQNTPEISGSTGVAMSKKSLRFSWSICLTFLGMDGRMMDKMMQEQDVLIVILILLNQNAVGQSQSKSEFFI